MTAIHFLVDENFPARAAAEILLARGHEVSMVGAEFAKASPDHILVTAAEQNGLVLVTFDKDFKQLLRQMPEGHRGKTERAAGRLTFKCNGPTALARLELLMPDIEFNYSQALSQGVRLIIQISPTGMIVVR